MVNVKTPNKKRKSGGNSEGGSQTAQSPKVAKPNTPAQTPGKGKGKATPGKLNKTPKAGPRENNANTPNQTPPAGPGKSPKQTPFKKQGGAQASATKPKQTPFKKQGFSEDKTNKTPKQTPIKKESGSEESVVQTPFKKQMNSGKKFIKKNEQSPKTENEVSPAKKMKKFAGTGEMQSEDNKEQKQKVEKVDKKPTRQRSKARRKALFTGIKSKLREGDEGTIAFLEKKITALESRTDLSKTAKKKLKVLQKLRKLAPGGAGEAQSPKEKKQVVVKKETKAVNKNNQTQNKANAKPAPKVKVEIKKEEKDSEDSESDYEVEAEINPDKLIKKEAVKAESDEDEEDESGEEEESDLEEEESGEEEEDDEEMQDESGDDEEAQGESDDDDDDEEEEEEEIQQIKKPQVNKGKQSKQTNVAKETSPAAKKSRYVVFVGNLPYDATREEISEHFSKAGEVKHVRIPTDRKTNKPRGFAYAEFNDEVSYQKALSLHHTFIKGRRINVLYTEGGKKKDDVKKSNIIAKNLKLAAMRKQGQLHGSVKQDNKRSARRAKKVLNGSN